MVGEDVVFFSSSRSADGVMCLIMCTFNSILVVHDFEKGKEIPALASPGVGRCRKNSCESSYGKGKGGMPGL